MRTEVNYTEEVEDPVDSDGRKTLIRDVMKIDILKYAPCKEKKSVFNR